MSNTARSLFVNLPAMHPGQQIVDQQMARFSILVAGRRWRKTTFAMSKAVRRALQGQSIIWGAPTFDQVRVGWMEMKKACAGVFDFKQTTMTASAPGGGKVVFRSLDNPDNARGHTADGIILDESADIVEEAWYEVLRPMLIDTNGWMLALGTPKGKNWFWTEYQLAMDRDDAMAWQAPTVGARIVDGQLIRAPHPLENPDVPWSEMESLFSSTPERVFRQEILGEFLDSAGGVFHNVDSCLGGALLKEPIHPTRQYVMGVDLAKHNDYTVICVGDLLSRELVHFERFNQRDYPEVKRVIYQTAKHWNNALIWMDSTPGSVGDPLYDDLRRAELRIHPYQFTNASKSALINNAVLMIEQQQVRYPNIPVLLLELKAYEYERLPAGGLRMNAPTGQHDDAVIAFALMCWPMQHQSQPLPQNAIDQLMGKWTDLGGVDLLRRTF